MTKYAEGTSVATDRTLVEIKRVLTRYGASKVGLMEDERGLTVGFEMEDRRFRMTVLLPDKSQFSRRHINQHTSVQRTYKEIDNAWDQACRERYRALFLAIKAKMVAVESGIETLENAFLAYLCLPSGETMSEFYEDQIEKAYLTGRMPPLLGSGS